MIEDVIRWKPKRSTSGDLEKTPEFWQSDTFAERDRKIVDFVVEKTGARPSYNMFYIREGVFSIKENTKMEDLLELASLIRDNLVIDPFQISIDRRTMTAHMLFDWYDYKNETCFYLTKTHQLKLSVMIIRALEIEDIELKDMFLRHFLVEEYNETPEIFDKAVEWLRHSRPSKRVYGLILRSLLYTQKKCEGLVK